ncbi:hypothetical protein E2C01_076083 [Portunus trituberculatus]|uniref:Uncharacterized protein n=1 Tax=Portunus trituberculatus TaxID=210409 RepID=A0A5B7IHF4_PORTR|nr:hypothetical protein [Portunus trituberculatus]
MLMAPDSSGQDTKYDTNTRDSLHAAVCSSHHSLPGLGAEPTDLRSSHAGPASGSAAGAQANKKAQQKAGDLSFLLCERNAIMNFFIITMYGFRFDNTPALMTPP